MKLRYSPASPFVRKVTVTAIETGLDGKIERIPTNVWDPASDIGGNNPVGKVPALTTEGGEVLYDSTVICMYLDSLHDGVKLLPASGGERWRALCLNALGDGISENGIRRLLEYRFWGDNIRQGWIDRSVDIMKRCYLSLENDIEQLSGPVTIGQISIACAIAWEDFRYPDFGWRDDCPALADWFAGFSARPSMIATEPVDPK
ncbi:MAG: glutathione S-transferase [Rhodospirillaceae bacterium]